MMDLILDVLMAFLHTIIAALMEMAPMRLDVTPTLHTTAQAGEALAALPAHMLRLLAN